MATQTTQFEPPSGAIQPWSGHIFSILGKALIEAIERLSRADQVRRLDAKSDDELAEMGISRDKIVQHVFRDRLYL
ncbi:hypothetical protein [Tropicimonas sp.]|uniref:hypothetical protein n=1 Tax=Tropicimonas sp. TaxID=2067044 RepID=UPI003A85FA8D